MLIHLQLFRLWERTVFPAKGTDPNLESFFSGEKFAVKNAIIVSDLVDDENTLPHRVNYSVLEHFNGIDITIAPDRDNIDILVGQSDKSLLTVLEEREGTDPDQPNLVLTRFGPIVSGGQMDV